MATMQHVVTRALKRLALVPLGGAADYRELQLGNFALNDMLSSWEVDLGAAYSHTDKDLTDVFPFDDEHIQGVAAMLAIRLLDEKGKESSASIEYDAKQGWLSLQATYIESPEDVEIDRGLTTTPSQALFQNDILGTDGSSTLITPDGSSILTPDGSSLIF